LAIAFGTLSVDRLEFACHRSADPAVLCYATDDDHAGEEVERLIRAAGFEPAKAGGLEQSSRLEVGGDPSRTCARRGRGAVTDRQDLICS
jgi:8-hydroxy-5-deazaflavin:NADPH oxidoreductase